ncbi:MAG: FIST C-terminal domain-containing protein [Gemmatimonadota bacterium]|nr:FIST C-terminal domain-containing protein [Gemmatimonadota bacterium]
MQRFLYRPAESWAELGSEVRGWKAEHPGLSVIAFVAEADAGKVGVLQEVFRDTGVPLHGAIFPEVIFRGVFKPLGAVLLLMPHGPPARLLALSGGAGGRADGAEASAAAIRDWVEGSVRDDGEPTLFLVFDALVPDIETVLGHLYERLGRRVHYMGVNAGSETFQPIPCLFDPERLTDRAVLAILLPPSAHAVLEHCYASRGRSILATSTEGNQIHSIDGRPAFQVYQEMVAQEYGAQIDEGNFYQYAIHYPFGITLATGEVLVRIPVALGENGAVICVGEVPANSVLTLLDQPVVDSRETVRSLVTRMDTPTEEAEVLHFYCAGRRLHLAEEAATELSMLGEQLGGSGPSGAVSLGEIGPSSRSRLPRFHNATLIVSYV